MDQEQEHQCQPKPGRRHPEHAAITGIMTISLTYAASSIFGRVTESVTQLITVERNNIRTRSGNMVRQMTLTAGGDLTILGDPGTDRGGMGKSKPAKENGDEEKHSRARRAPGNTFLRDQCQTVEVILNYDWCQKFLVFFCPIRGQQAVKSFRVFLHGNHLIAILAWFVWQGFARGENFKSQSQHKVYRKSFGISAEKYVTVAYFQVCEICLKMPSPIHLK